MGFFRKIGDAARSLFGRGNRGNRPAGKPAPRGGTATFTQVFPTDEIGTAPLGDVTGEIGNAPGHGRDAEAEFTPMGADGEETKFLAGEPIEVFSSNVATIQYVYADGDRLIEQLVVAYLDGSAYLYENVTLAEARQFYAACASSPGGAVWDMLRVRGTVFGYQKPYRLISGNRVWHEAGPNSQARHEAIPPSGEPYERFHPAYNYESAKGTMGNPQAGINLGKKGGSKKVAHFTPAKAKPKGGGMFGGRS